MQSQPPSVLHSRHRQSPPDRHSHLARHREGKLGPDGNSRGKLSQGQLCYFFRKLPHFKRHYYIITTLRLTHAWKVGRSIVSTNQGCKTIIVHKILVSLTTLHGVVPGCPQSPARALIEEMFVCSAFKKRS